MEFIPEFIDKLEEYMHENWTHYFYPYTRKGELSALLIKNLADDKRTIFKFYITERSIGLSKIQKSIDSTPSLKGHNIDNYVFVGRNFRDNSKRYTGIDNSLTLLEVDLDDKIISLHGSMNIDVTLFNILIEFSDYLGFEINYDFKGILKHKGYKNGIQQIKTVETKEETPSVFFSYSWDNDSHKYWILKLAADLIRKGIKVIIDEWDLREFNNDMHLFMESGIRDSDYVIMVCTPNYAEKANKREGGVGIENTIITGEYYDEKKGGKYIPIVRNYPKNFTESLPSYLKTKYAIDFEDGSKYKQKFDELLRRILNVPKYKRPKLGTLPKLESKEL